ncbi:MAG: response regulator transcription factor [Chloroflexota bacterium]|nr:response regulator transcription factor [Chloroflexota bacterium]
MRLLIADDQKLFREGLRILLELRGFEVVAEAANGSEAIQMVGVHHPDIVLMDLRMPELDGLSATRFISVKWPEVKVVALTASEDNTDLFEAIKLGANGYLLKNLDADRLCDLLAGVARGEPALTPGFARRVLLEFTTGAQRSKARNSEVLSEREQEILELLAQGVTSNRELAQRLIVSENTIKTHLRNILNKLHLKSRAQAVRYALLNQPVEPPKSKAS